MSDASRRREYDDLLTTRSSSGGFSDGGGRAPPAGGRGYDDFGDAEFEFDPADQEKASGNFFESFSGFFKGATGAGTGAGAGAGMGQRPDANDVFGDVFEEMWVLFGCAVRESALTLLVHLSAALLLPCLPLGAVPFTPRSTTLSAGIRLAPEVANRRPFWSYTAGAAGAVLGYVVANVPGALAGGVHW